MAFESLSEKLQSVFKTLRGKGRLSEACKNEQNVQPGVVKTAKSIRKSGLGKQLATAHQLC